MYTADADLSEEDDENSDTGGHCNNIPEDEPTEERANGPEDTAHHQQLWRAVRSEEFTSPISTPVNASPAEALLMTLAVAERNNLSFKAFVDSVRLLNSLFVSPVIPRSQYLLDKLLISESGIERYFYCKNCSYSFGKIDHIKYPDQLCPIEGCKTPNHIKDLTKATFFALYSPVPQIELLFLDPEIWNSLLDPKVAVHLSQNGILSDLYSGKCYKQFAISLPDGSGEIVISFVICTDGSPLFKSSTFSVWPCFLSISELPPLLRMKNLLLVGLWFGNKHPPMDLYLEPIVNHLSDLSDRGFTIKVQEKEVKMRAFTLAACVDSGARGAVQGINTHSGNFQEMISSNIFVNLKKNCY